MKFEHASASMIKSVKKELLDLSENLKTTFTEDLNRV